MSSVGYGLLKSVLQNEVTISNLTNDGITEEHFIDKEVIAFRFIRQFLLEYGTYPTLETVSRRIEEPEAFRSLPEEPTGYWVSEVKERKRYSDVQTCLMGVRDCMENRNIEDALDLMGQSYLSIRETYANKRIVGLREVQEEVLRVHDTAQSTIDIPGIPFGFPYIDAISGGAQKGDFVVIVGQTGVGKTYLALSIGRSAHRAGYNVLFLSTELPNLQIARRALAMEGRISTDDLKKGRLSYYGREGIEELLRRLRSADQGRGNYFHLLPGGMFPHVDDLIIVIKELRPSIVIVDGAYLLQGKSRTWWEKNMEVSQLLKNVSLTEDIPVIGTYQYTKKDTGKLEGIGGGFAIPQIASIVFSFEYERKEDIGSNTDIQYRVLTMTKGRDGESGSIRVMYNMRSTQIMQDRRLSGRVTEAEMSEPDITREMMQDDEDFVDLDGSV